MLLFLDDERNPENIVWDVSHVVGGRVSTAPPEYEIEDVDVVRDVDAFQAWINANGVPETVSFDHDLGNHKAGDGIKAVRWLVRFCEDTNADLPVCYVHSKNVVGAREMVLSLLDYSKSDIPDSPEEEAFPEDD